MGGTLEFEFRFGKTKKSASAERSLRILVLADLVGDQTRPIPLGQRMPLAIDIDKIGKVMAGISPKLNLDLSAPDGESESLELNFAHLDDLHPDAIFRHAEAFASMRDSREALLDPSSFARTAEALGLSTEASPPAARAESNTETLDRLLGFTPVKPVSTSSSVVNRLVRDLVSPHVITDDRAMRKRALTDFDARIAQRMRRILQHPAYQCLESTWRGIWQLISEIDCGETLQVNILDVSRTELQSDLLENSGAGLRSALAETTGEDGPWSLLIGDFSFADQLVDIEMLAGLAKLAKEAGAPFLAAAQPSLVGCASGEQLGQPEHWRPLAAEVATRWQALRASPDAAWLGLCMPRLLARLPYGKATDAISAFTFEEMSDTATHESFLWSNPAYALALLASEAFSDDGWEMDVSSYLEVGALPSYIFRDENGQSRQKPCAEVLLSESAASAILGRGIMPMLSFRNRDSARLLRWQSVATPARSLSGVLSG